MIVDTTVYIGMNDPDDDADDVFLLDVIDPDEETVDDFLLYAIDSDGSSGDVSDDDADDVFLLDITDPGEESIDDFLLDITDPGEESIDDFLLDGIDSDGTTGDVSIGISLVLESCGDVTRVCVKIFTPGRTALIIGLGIDAAIGETLFIVSSQLCFFTSCSSITTPMILSALIIPISILNDITTYVIKISIYIRSNI